MTHPAIYLITLGINVHQNLNRETFLTLSETNIQNYDFFCQKQIQGVAVGAALFAYLAAAKYRQENPNSYNASYDWRYGRSDSESWRGSRNKSGW